MSGPGGESLDHAMYEAGNIEHAKRAAELQANRAKLNACPRHQFVCDMTDAELRTAFGVRSTCSKCGGSMLLPECLQYVLGYEAAGGDANVVWPGFRVDERPDAV